MATTLCVVFMLVASLHAGGEYCPSKRAAALPATSCVTQHAMTIPASSLCVLKVYIYICVCVCVCVRMHVCVEGDLRFASYYGDHMVLQKSPERAVLWGRGPEGAQVTLTLSGPSTQNVSVCTVKNGECTHFNNNNNHHSSFIAIEDSQDTRSRFTVTLWSRAGVPTPQGRHFSIAAFVGQLVPFWGSGSLEESI